MGIEELLSENRPAILRAAKAHGAGNVRVFGSVARGEASADSDVDLLVDLEPGRSLLDHAALVIELEALLGRRVDVAVARGLRSRIRDRVLKEAIPLWSGTGKDILEHDYFGIDLEEVWAAVARDVPALKAKVVTILSGGPTG